MLNWLPIVAALLSVALAAEVGAEESLSSIMARMRPQGVAQFSYRETRTMDLLAEPWEASGVLYAAPPDRMVKLQVQPERIVMAVDRSTMWYYDSVRRIRHSASVGEGGDLAALVVVMQALLNGDERALTERHRVRIAADETGWVLELVPLSASDTGARVRVSGPPAGVADRIVLERADGDRSELRVTRLADSERLDEVVDLLIEEAQGR